MDWGYNDPCCVLWHAVDGENRVYTYRELYVRETRAGEVASMVLELSRGESISYTVASPDMWQKRGAVLSGAGGFEGETLAELFTTSGLSLTPADNSRVPGWNRVRDFLAVAPDGRPNWLCFSDCRNLIRQLPALQFDQHNREDAADGDDHAPEALRYALMSRPHAGKQPIIRKAKAYDPLSLPEPRTSGWL